jgi:hypothetical protein
MLGTGADNAGEEGLIVDYAPYTLSEADDEILAYPNCSLASDFPHEAHRIRPPITG